MSEIEFIEKKIAEAEKAVRAREQMERVWRGGTNESWQKVGCLMSKEKRTKEAETHGRISIKERLEVQMFKSVLSTLKEKSQ